MHTPGPWHCEPEEASNGRGIAICAPDHDEILATITPEDNKTSDERDWANARLIAAAPELLEALKAWPEWWENLEPEQRSAIFPGDPKPIVATFAAIKKAEATS